MTLKEHKKDIMKVIESALDDENVHIQFTNKLSPNWEVGSREAHPSSRGKIILIETGTHEVDLTIENGKVIIKNV